MGRENELFIGRSPTKREVIYARLANRHGLVTGATGTGKTVTLQTMAEAFSLAGVPVFAADAKGDLSGMAKPGRPLPFVLDRAREVGLDYVPTAFPVCFWDLYGEQGLPVRTTIDSMGPLLLSRLMKLSDAQEGALNIVFEIVKAEGMQMSTLDDLRAVLMSLAKFGATTAYGNVSSGTVGVILRRMVVLEQQGARLFFGKPSLDILDLMKTGPDGKGMINILAADRLMGSPQLYAGFLLWLLTSLFEVLPEVGDPDKPVLVFFFDEAHLLFSDAPKSLLQTVERVVRLIRSKGVGVYFVTQSPLDVPDAILNQLGNRVQHALRAFTPKGQRAVKTAADTFRPNPTLNTARTIMELGKGVALVSVLDPTGNPTMVEKTLIRPPLSQIGPLTSTERATVIEGSELRGKYLDLPDIALAAPASPQDGPQDGTEPATAGIPGEASKASLVIVALVCVAGLLAVLFGR